LGWIGERSDLKAEDDHFADRDLSIGIGFDARVVFEDLLDFNIVFGGDIFGGFAFTNLVKAKGCFAM
jgi:hypothetical protein